MASRYSGADGFLVGGASLKGPDFVTICAAADAHYAVVKQLMEAEEEARKKDGGAAPVGWPSWLPQIKLG